ncbi:MAG TPA: VOC family protein [Bacillaceae bacterium]|nr:VOC family protein [Paenibacillus bovis]HLU22786.1 VOC family protein [Bacillaceae bacterium]
MALNPYIRFDGNARDAIMFYVNVFKLEEPQIMTFGSIHSEEELPPGAKDLVMHTELRIAGGNLMISDNFPGMPLQQGNNFSLGYISNKETEIREAFEKLKDGGSVIMELQETPWTKCYGSIKDKFNIEWQFSYQE